MDEGSEGMRGMDGYRGREGMRRTRLGEGKREWRDEGRDGGREREIRMRWREGEKDLLVFCTVW